jgi:predicted transglutaminase-like protease
MTLEELQLQADKDLKINDTELDLESLKTPQLHNQYLKHLTKYKLMLSRSETEYNIMKKRKVGILHR